MNGELTALGVGALHALACAREISVEEIARTFLAELSGRGPALSCVARLQPEDALDSARRWDARAAAGGDLPALFGVPLAHKDMYFRRGWLTECGSRSMQGWRADKSAAVLTRLDGAGALDLGRLTMGEFAIGASGHNAYAGTPANPWNHAHLAGGTSSGPAAAVAAGLIPAALGSDTGGSVRLPAAFCGIVGFKPTVDAMCKDGMYPCSPTLDHVGVLARSARDCALVSRQLLDLPAARARATVNLAAPQGPRETFEGLRIGIQRRCLLNGSHPDQESAFAAALDLAAQAGAHIIDIDIPDIEAANPIASLLIMVEAAALHRSLMESHEAGYLPETLARLATGFGYTAVDYRAALACRTHLLRQTMRHAFDRVDLLMTPTTPRPAPRIDGADLPDGGSFASFGGPIGQCLRLFNVIGLPAVAVPFGLSAAGLPLSVQLVARPYDDLRLLGLAEHFEDLRGAYPRPPHEADKKGERA